MGESADGWTYFVLTEDEDGARLRSDLARYSAAPSQDGAPAPLSSVFGLIEAIGPYGPADRRGPGLPETPYPGRIVLDIEIWPSASRQEARTRTGEVNAVLEATGGAIIAQDVRPQTTVVRAQVTSPSLVALLDLPVVERVRVPPHPFIEPSDWLARPQEDVDVRVLPGEPVGVLDDGVLARHPLLDGVVLHSIDVPNSARFSEPPSPHGTMVAGLAAYPNLEQLLRDNAPLEAKPLASARILEPDPARPGRTRFPEDVLEHLSVEQAVRELHALGVRVFNLSVTDEYAYSGPHVSIWTEALDRLVRELGIVLVVAAGNVPARLGRRTDDGYDYERDYPEYCLAENRRVAEPGVAALVLTVGSIALSEAPVTASGVSHVGSRAIAGVDELSPFSRTGPGFTSSGSIKPDVVSYGGNWVVTDTDRLEINDPGASIVTLSSEPQRRLFTGANGTSFAAPRVARVAADVWERYPDATANLVRALVGLAAVEVETSRLVDDNTRLRAVGHGRPVSSMAVDSAGNRSVMFYEGAIGMDRTVIHEIPVPPEFARGRSPRRFRIALAFDPPVRRQRREYLAGRMTFDLVRNMSPDEIEEAFGAQTDGEVTPLPRDRSRADLRPGSTSFGSTTLQVRTWRRQQLEIDDGDTYYVVVTHSCSTWAERLDEDYGEQGYALAVELVDEGRLDLDLHELIRLRLEPPVLVPVRMRP